MKRSQLIQAIPILLISFITFFYSCNEDDLNNNMINQDLTEFDSTALIFMLEEEKLARDTYMYLSNLWSANQFSNIQNSEQSHMNAIENLLLKYNIEYTILPSGVFANQDLQNLYDQFELDGVLSQDNALQIGATIEDLDIVDLQNYMDATLNTDLITVFERLQCGSRNHLRSFVTAIENGGNSYSPQFLTQVEFDNIIEANQEQCN